MPNRVLLCDISPTSVVKFALADVGERPEASEEFFCSNVMTFNSSLAQFLNNKANEKITAAAISTHGFEEGGYTHRAKEQFIITRDDLRSKLKIERVNIVNNFVARALSIPILNSTEKHIICGSRILNEETVMAVVGPHHGLGSSILVPDGIGGWTALAGEGGHSGLTVKTEREWEVVIALRSEHGLVLRETALSWIGLTNVWQAIHMIEGIPVIPLTAIKIVELAKAGDPIANEAIEMLTLWLADMAADITLFAGAKSGIFLTGELFEVISEIFDAKKFTERFCDRGALTNLLRNIPIYSANPIDMELIGLSTLFE